MADYITTFTKKHFHFADGGTEEFDIRDIAHSLSMQCRANGHFSEFYSVAQHCLDCFYEAQARGYSPRLKLACLLHDAGEAYVTDLPRPIKEYLTEYQTLEDMLLTNIYTAFLGTALSEEEEQAVAAVDDAMLYYEFQRFMGETLAAEPPEKMSNPAFLVRSPGEAEQEYLTVFRCAVKEL